MFVLKHRISGFKVCQIWFAERPEDMKGFDRVMYYCCKNDAEVKGFKKNASYTNVVNLSRPIEAITSEFNDTTRNEVRRAEKEKVEFRVNSDYDGFLTLFNAFIKRKRLKLPRITRGLLDSCKHILITGYYNGKLSAAHYYIIDDDLVWLLFSCSAEPGNALTNQMLSRSSRYLHYKAIEHSKANGYKRFSFSSLGNTKEDMESSSIACFKLGFGGDIIKMDFYIKDYSPILKSLQYLKSLA